MESQALMEHDVDGQPADATAGELVYRQTRWTRLTHWIWALCLFFLLLSGLQIFNAHPALYIGRQSGFQFSNSVLVIDAADTATGTTGYTEIFGNRFNTSGVLGLSGPADNPSVRAFPAWATIPSSQDLATGRVVHFFFAWLLSFTLLAWLIGSIWNGHLRRDLVPTATDLRNLPKDISDHARLRFNHRREYNTLQKLTYGGVLFVLLPLMILTGLAMSPSMNAAVPFLTDMLGGRQTARTIHFATMLLLVAFFFVHILMILAAGPINELRSIITGWYRTDPPAHDGKPAEGSD
ncbi:cytochrome b/b6 domain-containing protein [Hoeflea sp. 108]|uniref:cytochrome b/b6 domain-containing protein n=2 Tax=Hyphomicrobiales TaxID=356 RepID=UPI00036F3182